MWPWEHLAVGYLVYTAGVHAVSGRGPAGDAVVALVVGTQFPDVVDKPLAWTVGVLPSGTSLGHSLFVAVPAAALATATARRWGRPRLGPAFAVGYLSHLPADAVYPVLLGGEPKLAFLLLPVVPARGGHVDGFLPHLGDLVAAFLAHLATPRGVWYLLLEVTLLSVALWVWVSDGTPGLARAHRGR